MELSRIRRLAAIISQGTEKVDNFLNANGLPQPSFAVDGPVDIKFPSDAADIEAAKNEAVEAAIELQELLQGPRQLLRPIYNATSLQAIHKYDIPSKVPLNGHISIRELAELCALYEPDLRRMLRYAIAYHRVFCEPRKGYIAHSAASRLLVDDFSMRQGLGGMFDSTWQSYARTLEAMELYKSQEPTATGWNLVHDTTNYHYHHISENWDEAKRVAGSMRSFATHPDYSAQHLATGYDWSNLGDALIVDVGGCEGHVSAVLAEANPSLHFIVQDFARMIEGAAEKLPPGVRDRVAFMVHDFLTEQTVKADVYLFRWIFHNWPDHYCIRILQNLIPALKSGAKIIISDAILTEPGTLPLLKERMARAFDMLMLTLFNSREREEEDWQQLIRNADQRFKIKSMKTPTGSALGIIEVEWEG